MLVEPPITELLKKVDNRYSLIIMTSRRARQLAEGATKLTDKEEPTSVSTAVDEIFEGDVYQTNKEELIEEPKVEEVAKEEDTAKKTRKKSK